MVNKFTAFLIGLSLLLCYNSAYAQLPGYSFRKLITVDNTQVSGTADLTNFPVLINRATDSDLISVANGGEVRSNNGYDIAFTAADGVTQLDHEIELYVATTGQYVAWVRIPTLAWNVDTDIYMYYGNSSVTTDQSTNATWDTNYKGIYHLKEDPSTAGAGGIKDATSNGNDGTDQGGMVAGDQVAGQVGGAFSFDNGAKYVDFGDVADFDFGTSNFAVSLWVKGAAADDAFVTKSQYNVPAGV
jgi:hypothetical protein